MASIGKPESRPFNPCPAPAPPHPSVQLKTHIILSSVQVTGMVASASHTVFSHPTQEDLRRLSSRF